ncbi:MAG: hypothetical protein EPO27_15590 [Betaproteobacteria bacterium]|nr:MAG: hypothetical protein EPO27_15590 [Betaproteobacteria bacterium]
MRAHRFHKGVQEQRRTKVVHLAGPRYTPKLNVGVNIASVFDALGRTRRFCESLKKPANELLKNLRSVKDEELAKFAEKELAVLQELSLKVANLVLKVPQSGVKPIPFDKLSELAKRASEAAAKCLHLVYEAEETDRKRRAEEAALVAKPGKKDFHPSYDEKYRNERHYLHQIMGNLRTLVDLSESNVALAANNPWVVLNGIAGSGKTHFLCDLAKHRVDSGLPTFIFLGEEIGAKNPWEAIRGLLGVPGGDADFLAALNRYAAAKRTRALVIVDAVNESLVRPHWARLNKVRRFKNLAMVLSVRSGFEQSDLPSSILESYVRVEHPGFAEHEWEAVTKFFNEYKLPLLEVPLLFPEFRIPLFLKIFCESFAGSKQAIKGHYGFTHIFEQYVKRQGLSLLKRLGETAHVGESRKRVWDGSIKEIALYMGEHGTDRVSESQALTIVATQFPTKANAALGLLEKYWLLTKVPRYNKYKVVGFDYRFPYQKFSDHLIVRNLLEKHLNPAAPLKSFKTGTVLHGIVSEVWRNRGLIEALSIQIPQRLRGRELIYVAPRKFRHEQVAKESFFESLIWRDLALQRDRPRFIKTKRVLAYLNKYILPYHGGNEQILETVLTVSAVPHHPLNARLLHRHLLRWRMPKRDAFWLPFINSRYGDESAVNRLITWAWDGGDKSRTSDESLRLAGITLAWCLASSNRFLRDRATKALVSMFVGRIPVLTQLLETFARVDDSYVSERLYAAAYGCVLQPGGKAEDVTALALAVYRRIFQSRRPPVHLLLRDYARGVIEVALAREPALAAKIDAQRIRPPYGSTFPSRAPSLASLRRKYYPKRKSYKPKDSDYWAIWHSLMYNNEGGVADFANYVVNSTLNHWCNLRIAPDGTRPKTAKELDSEFNARLTEAERAVWDALEDARRGISMSSFITRLPVRVGEASKATSTELDVVRAMIEQQAQEQAFVATLSAPMQGLYREGVLPYRKDPRGSDDLDYGAIQRLIFARIVELGWRPKLFHKYDSSLREHGREAHKVERIGKKYQWIAFHEVLGRIADNFVFRGNWREDFAPYSGPWQMWERDIDPSCLLRTTPIDSTTTNPWWSSYAYSKWRPSLNHAEWTKVHSDLPDQKRLLEVKARGGWLVLDAYFRWEQPPTPGEERFSKTRRDVWYIARSYIVRRKDADDLLAWGMKQDFMGRWMPDPTELRHVFLREIPRSIAYREEFDAGSADRWVEITDKQRKATKFQVLRTSEEYMWEGSGFDCSVDQGGVRVNMPSRELIEGMRFVHGAWSDRFVDAKGELVVLDPAVAEKGPSVLLIKKAPFLQFLRENDYELFWIVLGEKLLIGGGAGRGFPGRLEMGGAFRLKVNGKIDGGSYTKHLPPTGS